MTAPASTETDARIKAALDAVLLPLDTTREALVAADETALREVLADDGALDLLRDAVLRHEIPHADVRGRIREIVLLSRPFLVQSLGGLIIPSVAGYAMARALWPEQVPPRFIGSDNSAAVAMDRDARMQKALADVLPPDAVSRERMIEWQLYPFGAVFGDDEAIDLLFELVNHRGLPHDALRDRLEAVAALAGAGLIRSSRGSVVSTDAGIAFTLAFDAEAVSDSGSN